jgi:hypothetical protein
VGDVSRQDKILQLYLAGYSVDMIERFTRATHKDVLYVIREWRRMRGERRV